MADYTIANGVSNQLRFDKNWTGDFAFIRVTYNRKEHIFNYLIIIIIY